MAVEAYFNAETVWVSEFDKHASKVIDARIGKPNYGNLKVIDWATLEPIDILTAGYPCQPFSTAGLRKGVEDERHLWPYIKTAISILRPRYIILENVRGHFGLGFREVLGDLTSIGYDARWTLIRASDVGAPHRRERLFIVAYPQSGGARQQSIGISEKNSRFSGCNNDEYTHANSGQLRQRSKRHQGQSQFEFSFMGAPIHTQEVPAPLDQGKLNVRFVEYMMGLPKGWVTDVELPRTQMLKILGNGVVPQQAYRALEMLLGE